MKKILVSQRIIENESYPETREGLDLRWGSFFAGAGLIPCPVLSAYPSAELFEQLEPAGVLLSGGNDLSQLSNTRLNVSRDKVDTKLLDQAVARNVPVLGVCRGMQFIAHYFDSTLEPVDKHIACDHNLEVNVDSRHAKLISPCLLYTSDAADVVSV